MGTFIDFFLFSLYNARSFEYFLFLFTNLIIYIEIWQVGMKALFFFCFFFSWLRRWEGPDLSRLWVHHQLRRQVDPGVEEEGLEDCPRRRRQEQGRAAAAGQAFEHLYSLRQLIYSALGRNSNPRSINDTTFVPSQRTVESCGRRWAIWILWSHQTCQRRCKEDSCLRAGSWTGSVLSLNACTLDSSSVQYEIIHCWRDSCLCQH